jgi:hypothetical protein
MDILPEYGHRLQCFIVQGCRRAFGHQCDRLSPEDGGGGYIEEFFTAALLNFFFTDFASRSSMLLGKPRTARRKSAFVDDREREKRHPGKIINEFQMWR